MTHAEILELLPAFERQTRRRAAEAVARRLALGRTLAQAASDALSECGRLRRRLDAATAAWFAASPTGRRRCVRAMFLAVHGRAPSRRELRALTSGRLDLDALREQGQRAAARLEAQAQVAFLADHARSMRDATLPLPLARVALELARHPTWRLARSSLLAMADHAGQGRAIPKSLMVLARRLAADRAAPVWTQCAALELLAGGSDPHAPELLEDRLTPSPEPDDLFVRAAAVRIVAVCEPELARELLAAVASDPSEHVRLELASALGSLEATAELRAMTDPRHETSPRVRAAAAIALAPLAPDALAAVFGGDPDLLPRRAALEEAEKLCELHPSAIAAIEQLAGNSPWPELARLAAESLERIHHRTDPAARRTLREVRESLRGVPEGGRAALAGPVDDVALGRALATLSAQSFGLSARRTVGGGWELARGDRVRRQPWRVLHEVRHPSPDKRRAFLHTIGRAPVGEVRAPPGGLCEVTATKVPGERVLVPQLGEWGRHLPTVDDLLARPDSGEASVFSAFGLTRVRYPAGAKWLAARAALEAGYARYDRLRRESLAALEPRARSVFVDALGELGFEVGFEAFRGRAPDEVLQVVASAGAPRQAGATSTADTIALHAVPFAPALDLLLDPGASSLNHLAAAGLAALGLFFTRQHAARRAIERARAAVPLSIGGWGTRGKSGTERLKAALLQALGCEVLVKTTGCEAMFIHCLPELPAQEIFIYRPYDKATIWEQSDLVRLAERLEVDVFLWECMALNPEYVELLEQHWMRDDLCTLTNAYPDHENIQGPAGVDIPRVMTRFIPSGKTLFTAEEQMLPILEEAAEQKGTRLVQVGWRDHALLPSDVLARFPYDEHPRNVALVLKLADAMGIERSIALKEMADHVVPDLGVLKTYPEAGWRGRRLVFSNGMSANERTGFLNNWQRCGFDAHTPDEPGEWVVTVVNNRADRVSRSMVFADILVDDASANAQVLIGTNLQGFSGMIAAALRRSAESIQLFRPGEDSLGAEQLLALAANRARRALARVKLGALGAERLFQEAEAMRAGLGVTSSAAVPAQRDLEEALRCGCDTLAGTREAVRAALEPKLAQWTSPLGEHGPDAARHLLELTARHAAVLRFFEQLALAARDPALHRGCEERFRALFCELFQATVVPLWDSALTGDQVVDAIARACPPGFRVRIMGIQNIKGTGLDFAYRWVSLDRTARLARALLGSTGADAVKLARELAAAQGIGILDCALASRAADAAAGRERDGGCASALRAAAASIRERGDALRHALTSGAAREEARWVRAAERMLDAWDGVARRHSADRVVDELAAGLVSHSQAALELRKLMSRQKGGWLHERLQPKAAQRLAAPALPPRPDELTDASDTAAPIAVAG